MNDDPTQSESRPSAARPAQLKIFFGMSAGVGKTFAMLREAQVQRARGEDVVIGWLQAHGRTETDDQAVGLERIPPRRIDYRGIGLEEPDMDAILARRPTVVLMDELAHSNAPGSRHPKRYQDVLELLDAGISVSTTVNIQHLESLADSVEDLSGTKVRERIPDAIFDRADEVQLVDISPADLQARLAEGKIYTGDASREAIERFFRLENLAGLRELALRQGAQVAGQFLSALKRAEGRVFGEGYGLLVAVSPSPQSEFLIRWTRRLAATIKSPWTCLHIDTGAILATADKERLVSHLSFARSLGAQVESLPGADVVKTIIDYARDHGVGLLVVGKSGLVRRRFGRTVTDRLLRESGSVGVIAVQERASGLAAPRRVARWFEGRFWRQTWLGLGIVALVTGLNWLIEPLVGYWGVSIIYLALISLMGLAFNRRAMIVAALVSGLMWNFLFIPPKFTLYIQKPEDFLMFGLYLLLAFTSAWATGKLRANERLMKARQERMRALSVLSTTLSGLRGTDLVMAEASRRLAAVFGLSAGFWLADGQGKLVEGPLLGGPETIVLNEREQAAARYCFEKGTLTGRRTTTLPEIDWQFFPLAAPGGALGIIGWRLSDIGALTPDQEEFLATMVRTIAIALEREVQAARAQVGQLAQEAERLAAILLHSVSHELRSPLTVITGSASALADPVTAANAQARSELITNLLEGAGRLNGIVENLLVMNRVESGHLQLKIAPVPVEELIDGALARVAGELGPRPIDCRIEPPGWNLHCDEVLMIQVLANLLQNCARYTPVTSRVRIVAEAPDTIQIADDGPGLPPPDLPRIFDKFWRGDAPPGGTGLGLAIGKGIVEAHGGTIAASSAPGGGLAVTIKLEAAP